MWPIGHVAGAYILYSLYRAENDGIGDITVFALVLGSLFPDLVDKPLAWYIGILPTGRSLGHSFLFIIPVCVAAYLVTRRFQRGEWGIAFAIGAVSHLVLDALPVLWDAEASAGFLLYPIVPIETYDNGAPTIMGLLLNSLNDPYFHLEFVFLAIALVLWHRHQYPGIQWLYKRFASGDTE